MKKSRMICLLLAFLAILQVVPIGAFGQENTMLDTSVTSGCRSFDGQVPLYGSDKILETAQSAMLYEASSGTVMYAWNPDVKVPPASLVKIMTCLLVLENCDIREQVTVTQSAMGTIDKTSATLKLIPGEKFTVDQLLYGLMVGSANDASVVLAEYVAGSQESFVAMMNQRAAELGCKDTVYTNAHGLHDDAQVTTARDIVRLVAFAMESEQFMEYFGRTSYTLPATEHAEERRVETTNYLITIGTPLYYDSRVTGGRTGITTDSLRSIVATAKNGDLNYISVVLSATPVYNEDGIIKRFGNYEEAKQLLSMGLDNHRISQVLYTGQILTQFNVVNGKNAVSIGPVNSVSVALPANVKLDDLVLRYGNVSGSLQAPVKAGEQVTSVEVWHGAVCVAYSPVITLNGSKQNTGSGLQENRYGASSKFWVVLLIILLIAAIGFGGYVLVMRTMRGVINLKIQRRYRKRRADRRRTR